MAKKSTAKSSKESKSANAPAPVKKKSAGTGSSKALTASSVKSERSYVREASDPFSGIVIGHAAGEIWGFLSTAEGGQTIAAIKKGVPASADVVLAAVGWLAREDKLAFESNGRTVKISLK